MGDGLVVRVDTFTGARYARSSLLPEDATSVRIERIVRSTGARPHPHATDRTLTSPDAVAELVDLVNDLPGAMTSPFVASCPVSRTEKSYSLTFATPHGSFVASLPSMSCWPQVTLQRDGAGFGPPLEPERRFARTLDHYLV